MSDIRIICPKCNRNLTIRVMPGMDEMYLTCPICRFRAPIALYKRHTLQFQPIQPRPVQPRPVQPRPSVFRPVNHGYGQVPMVGCLYIDNTPYQLMIGRNTVGRKAVSGDADIQIPTNDRFMSRNHVEIYVVNNNGYYIHQLRPLNPKNPMKINGLPMLNNADQIILKPGDILTLGHTDVLFDLPRG